MKKLNTQKLAIVTQFAKSYALPLVITAVFLAGLAGFALFRQAQLTSLPNKFAHEPEPDKSEIRLISQDEAAEIKTRNDNQLTEPKISKRESNDASHMPSGQNSGSTRNGNGGSGGDGGSEEKKDNNGEEETETFDAEILGMRHGVTDITFNEEDETCTVTHAIGAGVHTSNGPGDVVYQWKRSSGYTTNKEILHADERDNDYKISHTWRITSGFHEEPSDKRVHFLIHKPDSDSDKQSFEHSCQQP